MSELTVVSLIDSLGGSGEVAKAISKPAGTVAAWRHRGAIPVSVWSEFIRLAQERCIPGVTAESLLGLHSEGDEPSSSQNLAPPSPAVTTTIAGDVV